jgi:hypothetical protein
VDERPELIECHQILWKHDGSDIVCEIICRELPTAFCRTCDESCAHGDDVKSPHEDCLVSIDIMTAGATSLYCGDSTMLKSDWIEIGWDGSDWVWWYKGDTHARLEPDAPSIWVEDVIPDLSVVDETVGP